MIFHITTREDWDLQKASSGYTPPAYAREGFIHCSQREQVPGVLQRYYAGASNLIMLHIDESKLIAPLKYEMAANQKLYPHVFGAINKDAIVLVEFL